MEQASKRETEIIHKQVAGDEAFVYLKNKENIFRWPGHLVDSFGILVTVISMVTNLGIGALLVNSGLNYLFHIPQNTQVLLILIVVMMAVATLAAVSGVEKGIAMLSNLNVVFLCLLLFFIFRRFLMVISPCCHFVCLLLWLPGRTHIP